LHDALNFLANCFGIFDVVTVFVHLSGISQKISAKKSESFHGFQEKKEVILHVGVIYVGYLWWI